jgi:glycerol uptake facilitator protein
VADRISGAHLNPVVTLAVAAFRGFPWRKVIPYSVAQIAGAFCAAALVYWNYRPQFHVVDPTFDHTAGVFTTFPAFPDFLSAGLLDQTLGTAILLFLIFALIDGRNQPPQANLTSILIGTIVVGIGMAFGGMHGYAINPARNFGPRLFTVVPGFRNNGIDGWCAGLLGADRGALLGGLIGSATYDFGVRRYLPASAKAAKARTFYSAVVLTPGTKRIRSIRNDPTAQPRMAIYGILQNAYTPPIIGCTCVGDEIRGGLS